MKKILVLTFITLLAAGVSQAQEKSTGNAFTQTNLVGNQEKYKASIKTIKEFINAWGIAIRPAGKGGHFWVGAKDISYEYVGDVHNSNDEALMKLHIDKLETVKLPVGGKDNVVTGIVFSDSLDSFVITQKVEGVADVTAPSKFLFASDGGIISAWTERKHEDGTFDRAPISNTVIDNSAAGAQYFGIALNAAYNRLYVANFGAVPGVEVYGPDFKPVDIKFDQPFDENKNGKVDPGEYAPFNVQGLNGNIFVAYAKTQSCPAEEVKKGTCKAGELFVGEEDTAKDGNGKLAQFTEDGKLIATWEDAGHLSAPWGMAFAPEGFGKFGGSLLVANFGSGHISAFDKTTHKFVDYLRDEKGKEIKIEKIWGLIFGNGESLGDSKALYFTAGPDDEKDGLFGSLRSVEKK